MQRRHKPGPPEYVLVADLPMQQRRLGVVYLCLFGNGKVFMLDFEPQMVENTHVDVGDPHQGKLRNQVATPALVQKLKTHQENKN